MSLLDRGREVVTIYPEVTWTDDDGNVITKPSPVGVVAKATIQPITTDTDDADATGNVAGGPTRYRLRLPRSFSGGLLGRQSAVDWNGDRWSIIGDPQIYNGSRRTAHVDYTIGRI
jgi:hypothetical protein